MKLEKPLNFYIEKVFKEIILSFNKSILKELCGIELLQENKSSYDALPNYMRFIYKLPSLEHYYVPPTNEMLFEAPKQGNHHCCSGIEN